MDENDNCKSLISKKQLKLAIEGLTGKLDPEIVDLKVDRPSKGVEGLSSNILRVKVGYKYGGDDAAVHRKTYVVKTFPQTECQKELARKTGIFLKETSYFNVIQPFFKRLLEGKKISLPIPESDYAFSNGTEDAIYFDDLRISGFRTANQKFRISGLDLPHCEVVMELLGRLHGLSAAAERLLPEPGKGWEGICPSLHREICFYEASEGESPSVIRETVSSSIETVIYLAKKIEGLPEEAAESGVLEKLLEGVWKKMCLLTRAEGYDTPKVLCHGDFWMNNIMFRYDETGMKPLDAKAIDFQVTRYSHPCTDIFHFLYGCTGSKIREQHMDYLLEVYHRSMSETMEQMDLGPPLISLDKLKSDANGEYRTFGVVIGALWHPPFMLHEVYCVEDADNFDPSRLEDLLSNGNSSVVRKKFEEDEHFRKEMSDIVRDIVDVALPKGLGYAECSPFNI